MGTRLGGLPPSRIALEDGDVHVWHASLSDFEPLLARCWDLLSGDERARASRYFFERDRRQFVTGRGLLRAVLASYTGLQSSAITLQSGPDGKPKIDRALDLEFNVSHSGNAIVYALARRPVGVDVEQLRPMPDALDLAERFFSRQECDSLKWLDDSEFVAGFFRCWTRKEAYVKAKGDGLFLPLDSFSVSLDRERPALIANNAGPTHWTLRNLDVAHEYVAALAVPEVLHRLIQLPLHLDGELRALDDIGDR